MLKRTALYPAHLRLGARMIDFGGWELPIQYKGVITEHLACRSQAGLFDVSHMGEFEVEGEGATEYLNYLMTQDLSRIPPGKALYTVMCNAQGGIIDDLVIYRKATELYWVVVNASNIQKDYHHMEQVRKQKDFDKVTLKDLSHHTSLLALQGKHAASCLEKAVQSGDLKLECALSELPTYGFTQGHFLEVSCLLARTGYTGEDGFEIYTPWNAGLALWEFLLKDPNVTPCGLASRDTLRIEMKYALYGHELTETVNPIEAGLNWVIKWDKPDFIGKEALLAYKTKPPSRALVGLKCMDKGILRQGYKVIHQENSIGEITSGTFSPSLQQSIAIGWVPKAQSGIGTSLHVDIRGAAVKVEVVPTPFYNRPKERK